MLREEERYAAFNSYVLRENMLREKKRGEETFYSLMSGVNEWGGWR
jgi:hypothetical protein